MKHFGRKKILFVVLGVLLAGIFSVPYLWQRFYYDGPKAAFYELALALEREDKSHLKELTSYGVEAKLYAFAKPYGGISKFGKYLQLSPEVSPVIHMVATVDVFATVKAREIMFMFSRRKGRWVVITVFFTDQ